MGPLKLAISTSHVGKRKFYNLRAVARVAAGLVEAARPGMWLKTLALMLVASTYTLGDLPDLRRFLAGFLIVGPLLWGGLYMLNAVADVEEDAAHPVKRLRPFSSGRVSTRLGAWVGWSMTGVAIILSLLHSTLFLSAVVLMWLRQLAYSLPPLRMKRRLLWDVLTGSIGNSTLRFAAGWFLFSKDWHLPLLLLLFAEGLQLAGFLVGRLFTNYSVRLEASMNYSSTTSRMSPAMIQRVTVGSSAVGIACFIFLALNSSFGISVNVLGLLPVESLIVLLLLLVTLPFFGRAVAAAGRFSRLESHRYQDLWLGYLLFLSVLLSMVIKVYS